MVFIDKFYEKNSNRLRQTSSDHNKFNPAKQVNVDLHWPDNNKGASALKSLNITGKIGVKYKLTIERAIS